ncbi:hypothetical protein [Echinicola vietnamensis]|uniref:Uncharacterized protein n=1 Tax=Echinicola vietnamensis (strain DSM 17526 / LMG 23754 / KMM 6221) TaxID=926556 RepID=L0G3V2_ECHVK|nr:hypothetical protein [Echinicola vietnamensis]AGA79676.1 hypothetical protein Echvi_3460 [Echinicola vietnamensis DSM 17526]
MELPSLAAIKKELQYLPQEELVGLLLETAKFTRDNKQFLFFKVFGRENPQFFQHMVEEELADAFESANMDRAYYAKKSAQAISRKLNKYLKFTKDKTVQLELVGFFCTKLIEYQYLDFGNEVIHNLYEMQVAKVRKIFSSLHPDLQYDYQPLVDNIEQYSKHV